MAEAKEKIPEFRRTKNPKIVIQRIDSDRCNDYNLAPLFDEYPDFSVREAILRRWSAYSFRLYYYQADWIEARICDLGEEEIETHSGFWKELLSCYIFSSHDELVFRAIEFAIGLTKKEDSLGSLPRSFYRSDILKIIAGKLDKDPEIYWNMGTPSLKLFLESFLVEAYQPHSIITYDVMVDIRRSVRCAIKVEDWQFLTLIEKVLYNLYNQERPEKYEFKKETERKENLAFLKEAVQLCRGKTEKEKETIS